MSGNMQSVFTHESAKKIVSVGTLTKKMQTKITVSPRQNMLTPDQTVLALN